MKKPKPDDVIEWVVNDSGELGVRIINPVHPDGDRFFFLYKGYSIEYSNGEHDDGSPMYWREVYKREFGECCHPLDFWNGQGNRTYKNFKDSADEKIWKVIPKNRFNASVE